jgi:hypothetical protein
MRRSLPVAALLALLLVGVRAAGADEPKPAPPAPPALSSDADVAVALEKFKEDFKAKGLKGDDRTMQRDYAMEQLAKLQHPLVVEALAKVTNDPDPMLRTSAVLYLGEQKACPGAAGLKVVAAMKKNADDTVFVMSALQALGALKYLGARDLIKSSIKEEDFAIKKSAIIAVGETGDMRLLREILVIIGITPTEREPSKGGGADAEKSGGGKEVVEEGYSWEGAEATVDWGMSDNSAENAEAERQVKEQIAKNQAEAAKAAGSKSGSGGGPGAGAGAGGEGAKGRGAASRSTQELVPYVRTALRKLTGEQFSSHKSIVKWLTEHREDVIAKKRACDEEEKRQAEAAKAK